MVQWLYFHFNKLSSKTILFKTATNWIVWLHFSSQTASFIELYWTLINESLQMGYKKIMKKRFQIHVSIRSWE